LEEATLPQALLITIVKLRVGVQGVPPSTCVTFRREAAANAGHDLALMWRPLGEWDCNRGANPMHTRDDR